MWCCPIFRGVLIIGVVQASLLTPMFPFEIDGDLRAVLHRETATFEEHIIRGFTDFGVPTLQRSGGPEERVSIQFDDVIVKQTNNTLITIRGLHISHRIAARLTEITTDLSNNFIECVIDLNDAVLLGDFELVGSDQSDRLAVLHSGKIKANVSSIRAHGRIGVHMDDDLFVADYFDLHYSTGDVYLQTAHGDDDEATELVLSELSRSSLNDSIYQIIEKDLRCKIENVIRTQLNNVLRDLSIASMFRTEPDMLNKYRELVRLKRSFANRLIDNIIHYTERYIIDNGLSEIDIEGFSRDFNQKFGFISVWGKLSTSNGTLNDLSSIRRTGNFTIAPDGNGALAILGSIGFGRLQFKFHKYDAKIWSFGPTGQIAGSVGKNSMSFKMLITTPTKHNPIRLTHLNVRIDRLDNIRIQTSGLNVALDWLATRIGSWTIGYFKKSMVTAIEDEIGKAIESIIAIDKRILIEFV